MAESSDLAPVASWPRVSAVIPTRDRPEMLQRAVRSVLDQDYPGDIECIVVFDGTPPHQPPVPTRPGRTLRTVSNERRPGLAGARNTGYVAGVGELIANCDDDDEWLPGKLMAQVTALREDPSASMVATALLVHHHGTDIERPARQPRLTLADLLVDRHMEAHPSSYLMRRELVLGPVGLVDEDLPGSYAEDYDYLLRHARHGVVLCLPQPLVRAHWHDTSFFANRWEMIDEALSHLLAKYPEFDEAPRGRARIEGQIAFARASLGQRRDAVTIAAQALRHNPGCKQAWAALAVGLHAVSSDRVVAMGRRVGRGI